MNKIKKLKGLLLIASPALTDPNFLKSVIFVLDHDSEGAFGLIINKPLQDMGLFLNDSLIKTIHPENIFFGGPVNPGNPCFMIKSANIDPDTGKIGNNIIFLNDLTDKSQHELFYETHRDNKKIFFGYTGWGKGQLETEIKSGVWGVIKQNDAIIFSDKLDDIWKNQLKLLGGDSAIFANMPDNMKDLEKN